MNRLEMERTKSEVSTSHWMRSASLELKTFGGNIRRKWGKRTLKASLEDIQTTTMAYIRPISHTARPTYTETGKIKNK